MATNCEVCDVEFSEDGHVCPSCESRPECTSYPAAGEVERATHEQLARWHRFLPPPGESAIGLDDRQQFERVMRWEGAILDRIEARFREHGGMNPTISKKIGWDA